MTMSATHHAARDQSGSGIGTLMLVALAAFGVIAIAWAYEIFGGLEPCPLCLQQRWAYYFTIPALFAIALFFRELRQGPGALLLALVLVAFAANVILAAYHSGVEWKWWAGPTACSSGAAAAGLTGDAGNLLGTLEETRVIRCDEAPWRFLGLSFAGWNVIISAIFFAACFSVFRRGFRSNA